MAVLLSMGAWAQQKTMVLRIDDMHCKKCSDRITAKLVEQTNVDSIRVSLGKHSVTVRYDENEIGVDSIRNIVTHAGYTPVSYCENGTCNYAYFLIPAEQATQQTLDKVKTLRGILDANTNVRRKSLAVAYRVGEVSADQLLADLQQAGIQVQLPKPHVCKEENANKQ